MWTNKLSKNYGGESHKLRTLRKSEKEFTSEGDHARAAYVKNEINKLEEIERQNAQQNYEKDYKNAKEKLQFKFQNEMRQFMRERTLQRNMIIGRVNKTVLITKPKPTTSARPISQLSGYLFDQKTQSQRNRNRTNYSTTIFNQPNQLHHDESFTSQTESNQNDSETSQKECNCDNNNHEIEPNLAENHEFEGMFIDDDVSTCVGEINNNQNGSNNSDVQIKSRSISSFDDKLHNTPNDTSKSETDINHSNSKIEEEYYEYYDDSVESTIHNETENENDDEKDRNIDENQRFENHSENELDNFELNVSSDDSFITKNKNNHIDENTSETTKEDGEISIPFDIDESKEKFTEIKERAIILGFNYQSDEIESGEVEDGELVPFESLSQEEMSENTLITKNEEGQIPNKNSSTELEYSTISSSEKSTKDDSPKDDSTKEDSPKDDSTKEDSTKEDSPKEYTNKEDSNKEDSSNGLSA
ncbi:hypothetical protein TRFO_31055 [Tritrichomonas foetus]|uniref:Uncharacterized protein n=1 Tax=Tritrichomonas foetus TaxID=1144522 RepID=A0A1J4JS92_9EUKA|nr:hypothetical protein TRFO_31055 [Tritrichomonas foetus]|eukprot:OHT01977.1 hypothetical protein TRFO_31055 [Tritrichomonas foetus]